MNEAMTMTMNTTNTPAQPTPPAADALPQAGGSYTRLPDGTLVPTDSTPQAEPTTATKD